MISPASIPFSKPLECATYCINTAKTAFSLDGKFFTDKKSKIPQLAPAYHRASDTRNFFTIFSPKFSYIALKQLLAVFIKCEY
ncbi:MAG: hypothetical protein CVU78_04140 [Elusimicrobia bacterium HGW-Elusimicrobia-2]|nr:MAG: hypothetical protein CVU78_04140 [Elusimicrobia bacterium HGW-Elusimicrobia-2]